MNRVRLLFEQGVRNGYIDQGSKLHFTTEKKATALLMDRVRSHSGHELNSQQKSNRSFNGYSCLVIGSIG